MNGKEDGVHVYNGILLITERNGIMPFAATWMDLEIIIKKYVRERQTSYDITYIQNLKKNDINELIYKTDSQIERTNLWQPGGKDGGRDRLGVGNDVSTLLCLNRESIRTYCVAQGTLLNIL